MFSHLTVPSFQIPTNMNGLIEYRAHPFWLQKYCPSHEVDGTPRCCSCERMEVCSVTTLCTVIWCCGYTLWLDKVLCMKFGSVRSNMVHLLVSQGNQDTYCWMMVESSAWSALILQWWIQANVNLCILKFRNFMKVWIWKWNSRFLYFW